jgi:hypothetical protein
MGIEPTSAVCEVLIYSRAPASQTKLYGQAFGPIPSPGTTRTVRRAGSNPQQFGKSIPPACERKSRAVFREFNIFRLHWKVTSRIGDSNIVQIVYALSRRPDPQSLRRDIPRDDAILSGLPTEGVMQDPELSQFRWASWAAIPAVCQLGQHRVKI